MQTRSKLYALALLGVMSPAFGASPVAECRDSQLQGMTAEQLRAELSAAGARNCTVRSAHWGDSVACQGTEPGARAFGLPVREFSAEVQRESGKRTLQVVTKNPVARVDRQIDPADAATGLDLAVEQDATGVSVISCVAMGPAGEAAAGMAATRDPLAADRRFDPAAAELADDDFATGTMQDGGDDLAAEETSDSFED